MIFSGLTIENVIATYNVNTEELITATAVHINYGLVGLNILFFALSLIFFILDFYQKLPDVAKNNIKQ